MRKKHFFFFFLLKKLRKSLEIENKSLPLHRKTEK